MQKVFVAEDDESIREMVLYALTTSGFEAEGFEKGDDLLEALERGHAPALVLLDIMLPGSDGLHILRQLRQSERHRGLPVIMLTAKGGEMDRIRGLELGADDYITKPFSVMEVISRVKAVLRRCAAPGEDDGELRLGDILLHRGRRLVWVDGGEVPLTYKEFELLSCLMRNEGLVLSREQLLDRVWGFDYGGESRTVDMHIKSLRQKLGAAGETIKTVRNVGYKIGG